MELWIESSVPDHEVVTIYGDKEGLENLLDCLKALVDGLDDDCHFFTPSYGDTDLTEKEPQPGAQLVHQLNVYLVDEEHPL